LLIKVQNAQMCDARDDAMSNPPWLIKNILASNQAKSSCEITTALTITNCLLV